MNSLEDELERARDLSVSDLADAIEAIGFECTHCGACCKAAGCDESGTDEEHTATVFPDEVRRIQAREEYDWRDVARPMPYGLTERESGDVGETFEWALQTDGCGDCTFYDEEAARCGIYGDRPLICRTYPFSVDLTSEGSSDSALGGTSQPMGEAVDSEGMVRAHECEGLGRDIARKNAETLAEALKERAVRELEEAIDVRDNYEPVDGQNGVVVHDSEGPKHADGSPY